MPSTRRQYAQLMAKVLKLAGLDPCRVIGQSPLPPSFLPKVGAKKAKAYLYPVEDEALLGCAKVLTSSGCCTASWRERACGCRRGDAPDLGRPKEAESCVTLQHQ